MVLKSISCQDYLGLASSYPHKISGVTLSCSPSGINSECKVHWLCRQPGQVLQASHQTSLSLHQFWSWISDRSEHQVPLGQVLQAVPGPAGSWQTHHQESKSFSRIWKWRMEIEVNWGGVPAIEGAAWNRVWWPTSPWRNPGLYLHHLVLVLASWGWG